MSNKRLMNFKAILINFAFLIVIFHFSFFIFHLDKAEASALSLSLDPSIIEINAVPPAKTTTLLSIENKNNDQVQLKIELRPFKAKLENARPPATSSTRSNTKQAGVAGEVGRGELEYLNSKDFLMARNIQILDSGVPVEGITLGPKQQKNLTLNVNIPKDTNVSRLDSPSSSSARRADYYFSIIFVSNNSSAPNSTASLNQLGIATNVLLSVGAKENPDAVLEEFSSGLFFPSGPVPFTIRIKNNGAHFIKPKGQVVIKNMFGQSIGKLDLQAINVLSDSTRAFPKALWKENFLLGFYTATLNISLSNEGPTFTKSIHFFGFPLQGLIVIIIILITGIVIRNRLRVYMKK